MRRRGAGGELGPREGIYQNLEIRIAKHCSSKPPEGTSATPEALGAPAFPLLSSRKLWGWLHYTVSRNLSPDMLSPVPLYCSSQASCLQNYVCPPTSFVSTSSRSQNKHAALPKHTNPSTRKKDTGGCFILITACHADLSRGIELFGLPFDPHPFLLLEITSTCWTRDWGKLSTRVKSGQSFAQCPGTISRVIAVPSPNGPPPRCGRWWGRTWHAGH